MNDGKSGSKQEGILREVFRRLERAYGYQGWWPIVTQAGKMGRDSLGYRKAPGPRRAVAPSARLEIILGTILTQNTAWENARRAIESLQRRGLLNAPCILRTATSDLASVVRASGYFNQKAKKIKALVGYLSEKGYLSSPTGRAPTRDELLAQWGVGPETADSILLYAYRKPVFVVDSYTERLLLRMGIIERRSYERTQSLFHEALEREVEVWGEYHALIVQHGKARCRSRPACDRCALLDLCDFGRHAYSPES